MTPSRIITDVINTAKKLFDLGRAQILLQSRPILKTMPRQIPATTDVYADYQASRQLTEATREILYPFVLKMEMKFTNASPDQDSALVAYTVPTLWSTLNNELVACSDGRHYYISFAQLASLLNHHEARRFLLSLQRKDTLELTRSYTDEIKEYIETQCQLA